MDPSTHLVGTRLARLSFRSQLRPAHIQRAMHPGHSLWQIQLAWGQIQLDQNYVLTAEFQLDNGSRLFNSLVIQQQITPNKFNIPDFGMPPSTTQPSVT